MVQEQDMQESALKNLEIYVILNIIAAVCGFLKDLPLTSAAHSRSVSDSK